MELKIINQTLKKNKTIIFGYKGSFYMKIDVNNKTIMFTTDTTNYIMPKKLEEVMEKLFKNFEITNFNVQLHAHIGDWHDKDIILKLKNENKISEVVKFIQDNFYNNTNWDYTEE